MVAPICRPAPLAPRPPDRLLRMPEIAAVEPWVPDIGKVVFLTHKKEEAEAILDGEGRWRCPKLPVLDRPLNALYEPGRFPRGDMPYGYAAMIQVAAWLKGEVRPSRGS